MFLLVGTIAFAGFLAGCGGDDDSDADAAPKPTVATYDPEASTTMTAASITKAEFIRRMNEICRQSWKKVRDNWRVYGITQDASLSRKERTAEAIEESFLAGIDFYIFDNFRILGAPQGEERKIEEIIEPFQAAVELGWKKIEAVNTFPEVAELFSDYNGRAHRYGLDDCLVNKAHLAPLES